MKKVSVLDIVNRIVDSLDDSRELVSQKRNIAAVNRIYYTMFHCVQPLLHTINISAKSHTGAHNAFHKAFILPGLISREHGLALKRTFEMRQFSDYDYDDISDEDAEKTFENATHFVNATIQYLKENNHLQ